jgi:hypothetical protein
MWVEYKREEARLDGSDSGEGGIGGPFISAAVVEEAEQA